MLQRWWANTSALIYVVVFGVITLWGIGLYRYCYRQFWENNVREIYEIASSLYERFWSGDELWREAILLTSGYRSFTITMTKPEAYCSGFALRGAEQYEQTVLEKYNELSERRAEENWYAGQRQKYGPLYDELRERAAALNLAIYPCGRKVEVWQILGLDGDYAKMLFFGEYEYTEIHVGNFLSDLECVEKKRQRLIEEFGYQPEYVENFCQKARFFKIETIRKEAKQRKALHQKNERIIQCMDHLPKWLQRKDEEAVS